MDPAIARALAHEGPLLAAWETWSERDDRWLGLFSVDGERLVELATARVAERERAAITAELRRRGVRVGAHDPRNEHVWCGDADGFGLWAGSDLRLRGVAGVLRFGDGRVVRADRARSVVSFVEDARARRGVRLELHDGTALVVAEETDAAPLVDPTYDRDNLAIDAAWAQLLGAALASWLHVEHINQIP